MIEILFGLYLFGGALFFGASEYVHAKHNIHETYVQLRDCRRGFMLLTIVWPAALFMIAMEAREER